MIAVRLAPGQKRAIVNEAKRLNLTIQAYLRAVVANATSPIPTP